MIFQLIINRQKIDQKLKTMVYYYNGTFIILISVKILKENQLFF